MLAVLGRIDRDGGDAEWHRETRELRGLLARAGEAMTVHERPEGRGALRREPERHGQLVGPVRACGLAARAAEDTIGGILVRARAQDAVAAEPLGLGGAAWRRRP